MQTDIQKATIWKRLAAWILDVILLAVLATGVMWGMSALLKYDTYLEQMESAQKQYIQQYDLTEEELNTPAEELSEEKRAIIAQLEMNLAEDPVVMNAWNMILTLSVLIITVSLLVATVILNFVLPLLFKHGRTVGKLAMGLGVIRQDGVKISTFQLFVRTLLGQFTLETMIPVYIVMMVFLFYVMNALIGIGALAALGLGQLICLIATKNNAALHDLMACTTVVDLSSQKVFNSSEELLEYTKRAHAAHAADQKY